MAWKSITFNYNQKKAIWTARYRLKKVIGKTYAEADEKMRLKINNSLRPNEIRIKAGEKLQKGDVVQIIDGKAYKFENQEALEAVKELDENKN